MACRQPSIVEIQILRAGQLVILCVPGEFTTMAGRRLREAVAAKVPSSALRDIGTHVLGCQHCVRHSRFFSASLLCLWLRETFASERRVSIFPLSSTHPVARRQQRKFRV